MNKPYPVRFPIPGRSPMISIWCPSDNGGWTLGISFDVSSDADLIRLMSQHFPGVPVEDSGILELGYVGLGHLTGGTLTLYYGAESESLLSEIVSILGIPDVDWLYDQIEIMEQLQLIAEVHKT